ncbi:hypothetical protein Agub_g11570 [Astrephomene gubernaculifera]|uniref:Uncharacterized protein n=1 Tax=Astrephomene gubernaculifera TaxID=47775 RepID=A0AAD3DWU9_9CHLO|nr:hypothetical protein Agub_g11570 [Astrephomene gubernaculifera]
MLSAGANWADEVEEEESLRGPVFPRVVPPGEHVAAHAVQPSSSSDDGSWRSVKDTRRQSETRGSPASSAAGVAEHDSQQPHGNGTGTTNNGPDSPAVKTTSDPESHTNGVHATAPAAQADAAAPADTAAAPPPPAAPAPAADTVAAAEPQPPNGAATDAAEGQADPHRDQQQPQQPQPQSPGGGGAAVVVSELAAALRAVAEESARRYCEQVVEAAGSWLAGVAEGLAAAVAAAAEEQIRKMSPAAAAELPSDWSLQLRSSLQTGMGAGPLQEARRQLQRALQGLPVPAAAGGPAGVAMERTGSLGGGGGGGAGGGRRGARGSGRERERERERDHETGSTGGGGNGGGRGRREGSNVAAVAVAAAAAAAAAATAGGDRQQPAAGNGSSADNTRRGGRGDRGGRARGGGGGGGADAAAEGASPPLPRFGDRGYLHDDRDAAEGEGNPDEAANWRRRDAEEGPHQARGSGTPGGATAAAAATAALQPPRKVKAGHQTYTPPARRGGDRTHADGSTADGEELPDVPPPGLAGSSGPTSARSRRTTREEH